MVQSALIFAFGFLTAALLALSVAPSVWRRAVLLTRKRIDSALPTSVSELNAEKDALRADHAMEVRRIEMRLDKFRADNASQKAAIADNQARIKTLEEELSSSLARGETLDGEVEHLRDTLDDRTTELSQTSIMLESTRTELAVRTDELASASHQIDGFSQRMDDARADIRDRDDKIQLLNSAIYDLKTERKENRKSIRELKSELNASSRMVAEERKRSAGLDEKLEQSIGRISDMEVKLDRREKEIERLREQLQVADSDFREMETRAEEAEDEGRGLGHEVGELTARVNRLSQMLEGSEPEEGIDRLKATIARQTEELAQIGTEREGLRSEKDELSRRLTHLESLLGGKEPAEGVHELMAQIDQQKNELSTATTERYALKTEVGELKARLEKLRSSLDGRQPEQAIDQMKSEAARRREIASRLEAERDDFDRRYREIAVRMERLKTALGDVEPEEGIRKMASRIEEQERQLGKAGEESRSLQGRMAAMTVPADGKSDGANREDGELDRKLETLTRERDSLQAELTAARSGANGEGDEVLRDKLNQLAAEVVAMAAKAEGPQSRVHALLENDKTPANDIVSLADRIKALQRRAGAPGSA